MKELTIEAIMTELENKGYVVTKKSVVKNGVNKEAITIGQDAFTKITPIIYTESLLENAEKIGASLEDVVENIINLYESNKEFSFDVKVLKKRSFFEDNLYLILQKDSNENIVKRPSGLDGIETYLVIKESPNKDGIATIKITSTMLKDAGLTEEEAWKFAEKNTFAETQMVSLKSMLTEMLGIEEIDDVDVAGGFDGNMFVITNTSKVKGSSAILNKPVLRKFAKEHGCEKLVVLPSSVHEMLVLPYSEEMDKSELDAMVKNVNETQVDPEERLSDISYILDFSEELSA